jgi:hypothetical protein
MPSSSGFPNARASFNAADSTSPACVHATPQTGRMCSSSGNGGPGGMVMNAKKPPSSSGAAGRKSRYQRRTSALSSRS